MPNIAEKMEQQWEKIIKKGHDIQIHLHPAWLPECGAKFDKNKNEWYWDEKCQRIHDVSIDIEGILRKCKEDLEKILKPINKNYQVLIFRAGKYQIQPNKDIFDAFEKVGIIADSSVWKGAYSEEYHFDFRKAYSSHQPYFASKYNINYLAPWGEAKILEIPILSNNTNRFILDNSNFIQWKKIIKPIIFPKKHIFLRFDLTHYPPHPFRFRVLNNIYNFYIKVLNKIEQILNLNEFNNNLNANTVITAIGHTKQNINLTELEKLFKYLHQYNFITYKKISDVAKEYVEEQRKHYEDGKYYDKHIQTQINYDYQAILGEKRNWQQSFYAQDKMPFDRKRILDLGCGAGYWTKRLNDNITKTIGIDISEDFLAKAQKRYPEIEFYKMDFHKIDFSDEYFDCVYADNVLEHSPNPQKVLKEIYRVLTKKGLIVALIPPDARNPKYSGLDHVWKTDKDEVEERLKEVGFINIRIEEINIVKKFKMSPYRASNNFMLCITAWKWKGGYIALERCKDLMNFVYNSLNPKKPHNSNNPSNILKEKYAWCAGYTAVMKYLCEKEGFKSKHFTLYIKKHPKGRGMHKIDTHEVLEILINKKWVVFDPTTNRCLEYDLETLLKKPKLVDKILSNYKPDKRWIDRDYNLYCSSWFYENVIKCKIN